MATNVPSKIMSNMNLNYVLDSSRGVPKWYTAIIHTYHGGPNQVFYLESNGAGFLVVSKDDLKVLEVPQFSDGVDGTVLQFAVKNGGERQRWSIQVDKFGGVSMQSFNGKYAAVLNGQFYNANTVVLSSKLDQASSWRFQNI
jgi:hypothetical protein